MGRKALTCLPAKHIPPGMCMYSDTWGRYQGTHPSFSSAFLMGWRISICKSREKYHLIRHSKRQFAAVYREYSKSWPSSKKRH